MDGKEEKKSHNGGSRRRRNRKKKKKKVREPEPSPVFRVLLRRRGEDEEDDVVRSTSPVAISSQSKKTKKESILRKNSSTNSRKKSNRNQNSSDVVKCITPTLRFPRPSPLHDRLRDSALNLVVGTLGFQGSGKSTVLSSLASLTSNKNNIFKAQSKKKRFMCSHETLGVRSVRAKEYHSH